MKNKKQGGKSHQIKWDGSNAIVKYFLNFSAYVKDVHSFFVQSYQLKEQVIYFNSIFVEKKIFCQKRQNRNDCEALTRIKEAIEWGDKISIDLPWHARVAWSGRYYRVIPCIYFMRNLYCYVRLTGHRELSWDLNCQA